MRNFDLMHGVLLSTLTWKKGSPVCQEQGYTWNQLLQTVHHHQEATDWLKGLRKFGILMNLLDCSDCTDAVIRMKYVFDRLMSKKWGEMWIIIIWVLAWRGRGVTNFRESQQTGGTQEWSCVKQEHTWLLLCSLFCLKKTPIKVVTQSQRGGGLETITNPNSNYVRST